MSVLGVWIISSKRCSFPSLSVEEGCDNGDMQHLCGDLVASLSELCLLLLSLHNLSSCLEDLLCDSLSHYSFALGELLLQLDDDFLLLVELGGAQGEEVPDDLLLAFGGSSSLLQEPGTSPKEQGDSCSSLLGLLECGFSLWKVDIWYPFLLSLVSSSPLNKRLSVGERGNILSTRLKSPTGTMG